MRFDEVPNGRAHNDPSIGPKYVPPACHRADIADQPNTQTRRRCRRPDCPARLTKATATVTVFRAAEALRIRQPRRILKTLSINRSRQSDHAIASPRPEAIHENMRTILQLLVTPDACRHIFRRGTDPSAAVPLTLNGSVRCAPNCSRFAH